MKLSKLMKELQYTVISENKTVDIDVTDICYDTRNMKEGCVFVCIKGAKADSHDFALQAVQMGAKAIVCEDEVQAGNAVVLKTADTREALALMACEYFDHPAKKLKTIGITGTKGKTTTSYMIRSILTAAGKKSGIIGSIGAIADEEPIATINTTPESYELQKILAKMVEKGCEYAVMEVSSQGLMLKRTAGMLFDIGIFLNISRDHISPWEHHSLEHYLACKSLLFSQCVTGLVNIDDEKCEQILKDHTCTVETFGFSETADTVIEDPIETVREGKYLGITVHTRNKRPFTIQAQTQGRFGAYDSVAAACACDLLGIKKEAIENGMKTLTIKGRVEIVDIPAEYLVVLDFAHDGIGISNLMSALRSYQPNRIIAVFGSDGNRTTIRRADAGEILGNEADLTVVTSNSPRYEPLEQINEQIKEGLDRTKGEYVIIPDRRQAIKYAMSRAGKGDVVVTIGKGHWEYEDIRGVKYPFNEREIIPQLFRELQAE